MCLMVMEMCLEDHRSNLVSAAAAATCVGLHLRLRPWSWCRRRRHARVTLLRWWCWRKRLRSCMSRLNGACWSRLAVHLVGLCAGVGWSTVGIPAFVQRPRSWSWCTRLRLLLCLFLTLLLKDHVGPGFTRGDVFANAVRQDLHPAFLLITVIGVEVDDFTIGEADTETLFNKHVALLIFSERRLAATARLSRRWLLQSTLVVQKLGCLCEVDRSARLPCCLVVCCKLRSIQTEEATTPVRAVTTLLAEETLPCLALNLFSLLEFANASVHALGHIIVGRVLRLGNVEELDCELSNSVRRSANDTTTLALDAADTTVIDGPFVEARDINGQGTSVGLALVVAEADVCTCEGAILAHKVVEEVPSGGLLVALGRSLSFLLLLKGKAVSLFLRATLLLFALLGRRKKVAEGRAGSLLGDSLRWGSCEHLRLTYWRLKLGLQGELELQIVKDNELELLSDRGRVTKL